MKNFVVGKYLIEYDDVIEYNCWSLYNLFNLICIVYLT